MKCRMLSALLLALVCSSAFAQQQALITVNPNLFSPGQNISNATAGATLLALNAVPNPDPNFPGTTIAQYFPVFSQPVTRGCTAFGIPCSLGNLTLGYSPTIGAEPDVLWGQENNAANSGCLTPPNGLFCTTDGPPVLRVNFAASTDYVTAAVGVFDDDGSVIEAFDGNGQSLGRCIQFPEGTPASFPPGCASVILSESGDIGWFQVTIARPTADISFVLIGGFGNVRPIARVQFHSPVSLQLAGLLAAVQGVGPGKSLANTLVQAQAQYAAGDIVATCPFLAAFADEVNAQSGKHIAGLTASKLLSTATAVEAGIGCN